MILTTRRKIVLASLVSRTVISARAACGAGPVARVRRNGFAWELDLREGIDFAIWLTGRFEGDLDVVCRSVVSAGGVVIDIGANMGAHTLPFARAVGSGGTVYAIEPTKDAFDRLSRNIALNPDVRDRIKTVQAMLVADDTQQLEEEIFSSWPLSPPADETSHPVHLGVARSTSGARATTLDGLLADHDVARVNLIKLDVDGFEVDVLVGARETIRRFHPAVVMELAPYVMSERGLPPDAAIALLRDQGYEFRTLAGRLLKGGIDGLIASLPHGASVNLVAMPASSSLLRTRD